MLGLIIIERKIIWSLKIFFMNCLFLNYIRFINKDGWRNFDVFLEFVKLFDKFIDRRGEVIRYIKFC